MDFTANNSKLTNDIIEHTGRFSEYIKTELQTAGARYGIGGYAEHRTVYSRSGVFDADALSDEPRRLHLGIDIWGDAGQVIFAPLDGKVHSYAFNDHFGDYGATIILAHELEGISFHTLYGHLGLKDISGLAEGAFIRSGQELAHFGSPQENGHWPPHLHFQVIVDIGGYYGDYPGVCKYSEKESFLKNCPDPDLILMMNRFVVSRVPT